MRSPFPNRAANTDTPRSQVALHAPLVPREPGDAARRRGGVASGMDPSDWPRSDEWVWNGPMPPPNEWGRPGLIMAFNLECSACISRGIPFLKRLAQERGEALALGLLHTSHGHRRYEREQVLPQLRRFAESFARLPFPIALDLDGSRAERWGAEGTPHWFVFDRHGTPVRSVYGSQENARTRLLYLTQELLDAA